jgi:hypothetical protein
VAAAIFSEFDILSPGTGAPPRAASPETTRDGHRRVKANGDAAKLNELQAN